MALCIPVELLEGKKLSFDEIYMLVTKHGFGMTPFTHKEIICGMSHGINYALLSNGIPRSEVEEAIDRFLSNDFGDFYDWDEEPDPGREYGCYPSAYGSTTDTGAIMVHREPNAMTQWEIAVYFQFER